MLFLQQAWYVVPVGVPAALVVAVLLAAPAQRRAHLISAKECEVRNVLVAIDYYAYQRKGKPGSLFDEAAMNHSNWKCILARRESDPDGFLRVFRATADDMTRSDTIAIVGVTVSNARKDDRIEYRTVFVRFEERALWIAMDSNETVSLETAKSTIRDILLANSKAGNSYVVLGWLDRNGAHTQVTTLNAFLSDFP